MASPDYKPIFKVPYNPVRGLAALLQGYNQGAQQKFQNNNTDRNAPIGVNEAARAQMEQKAKMQALMEAMNPTAGLGLTPFPGQAQPVAQQGYNVSSGQPNQPGPGIQGLPTNIAPVVQGPQSVAPTDPIKSKVASLIEELYQARMMQGNKGRGV
jgi:hypothetical protein